MSSGGGGGGGVPADTTNVQTIREAPEIEARRLGLMDAATELAKKPTSPPAFQVAPMSSAETAGLNLSSWTGAGAANIAGATTAAGQQFTAADVQAGMNPYIQNVVNRVGEDYAAKKQPWLIKLFKLELMVVVEKAWVLQNFNDKKLIL